MRLRNGDTSELEVMEDILSAKLFSHESIKLLLESEIVECIDYIFWVVFIYQKLLNNN